MAPYCKRLRTLSRDSPDQINQGSPSEKRGRRVESLPLTGTTATASEPRHARRLVAVRVRLVGATHRHVDVIGLLLREHGELRAERWEVEAGDLLVEILREEVDLVSLVLPAVALLPELDLREGLVRERARPRLVQFTEAICSFQFHSFKSNSNLTILVNCVKTQDADICRK